MAKILMLGCGNMGGALLARWSEQLAYPFTVIDPASPDLPEGVAGFPDASALTGQVFDALIIAIKPQLIEHAVSSILPYLSKQCLIISIAAGTGSKRIAHLCHDRPVIRLMPNMPAKIGRGVSGLYATDQCSAADLKLAEALAKAVGTAFWLDDEDKIDRITASAGSGPGYVYEFAHSYQLAVEALGFSSHDARIIVSETILGALQLSVDDPRSFNTLRNCITSKAGTTEAGLKVLNHNGNLTDTLNASLMAAYKRALQLGE